MVDRGTSPMPGKAGFTLVVRVRVDDPEAVSRQRLEALVGAAKPAHVVHRVEVVGASSTG